MTQEAADAVISRMPKMSLNEAYALIQRNLGQLPGLANAVVTR